MNANHARSLLLLAASRAAAAGNFPCSCDDGIAEMTAAGDA